MIRERFLKNVNKSSISETPASTNHNIASKAIDNSRCKEKMSLWLSGVRAWIEVGGEYKSIIANSTLVIAHDNLVWPMQCLLMCSSLKGLEMHWAMQNICVEKYKILFTSSYYIDASRWLIAYEGRYRALCFNSNACAWLEQDLLDLQYDRCPMWSSGVSWISIDVSNFYQFDSVRALIEKAAHLAYLEWLVVGGCGMFVSIDSFCLVLVQDMLTSHYGQDHDFKVSLAFWGHCCDSAHLFSFCWLDWVW